MKSSGAGGDVNHKDVQNIAKDTMAFARKEIHAGMTLRGLRSLCEQKMRELGADSFWYYGIGALLFSGNETSLSVSGSQYRTGDRTIGETDIVTIDLSPQCGGVWGDFARTIVIEGGRAADCEEIVSAEWKRGITAEKMLHAEMRNFVSPRTTFAELHRHMNEAVVRSGFVNLDFKGNLGHSIARRKEERIYIEEGNGARLGDVPFFTFEPHIGTAGSPFGYKREDIYYFEGDVLCRL